jgi:hypothetical protein
MICICYLQSSIMLDICSIRNNGSIKGRARKILDPLSQSIIVVYIHKCWLTKAISIAIDHIFSNQGCIDDTEAYIRECIKDDKLHNITLVRIATDSLYLFIRLDEKNISHKWINLEVSPLNREIKKIIEYECESILYKLVHTISCMLV